LQSNWDYVEEICKIFEDKDGDVYFVELGADFEEWIERNKTPYRLEYKPRNRDIARSEQDLKRTMEEHPAVISYGGNTHEIIENQELLDLFLPILRADFKISETYCHQENKDKIACDITVINGRNDHIGKEVLNQ